MTLSKVDNMIAEVVYDFTTEEITELQERLVTIKEMVKNMEDQKETQRDFIDEQRSDNEEEREVYDDDNGDTMNL